MSNGEEEKSGGVFSLWLVIAAIVAIGGIWIAARIFRITILLCLACASPTLRIE
jgi:hypothetical protein